MLGNVISFAVTWLLLDTHDYDQNDEIRAQRIQEKERQRREQEFDDYYQNLVQKVEKYGFNTSYT